MKIGELNQWQKTLLLGASGIVIGFFLVYFMALMVQIDGDFLGERRERPNIDFMMVRDPMDTQTRDRKPPEEPEDLRDLPQPEMQMAAMDSHDMPNVSIDVSALGLSSGVGSDGGIGQDSAPAPLVRVEPQYPRQAAMAGTEGWVRLRFDISETGDVINVEVIEAEPRRVFDSAARNAVLRWKYRPQMRDGKPTVRENVVVQLDFNLRD